MVENQQPTELLQRTQLEVRDDDEVVFHTLPGLDQHQGESGKFIHLVMLLTRQFKMKRDIRLRAYWLSNKYAVLQLLH